MSTHLLIVRLHLNRHFPASPAPAAHVLSPFLPVTWRSAGTVGGPGGLGGCRGFPVWRWLGSSVQPRSSSVYKPQAPRLQVAALWLLRLVPVFVSWSLQWLSDLPFSLNGCLSAQMS